MSTTMKTTATTTTSRWSETTPHLWCSAVSFACAAFLLGSLETASAVAAAATMWPGKLLGTFAFEPLVDRFGYRKVIYGCCLAQVLGAIATLASQDYSSPLLMSSGSKILVTSFITGLLENALPSYQADMMALESSSSSLSGFFSGSLMAFATLGGMLGAIVSKDLSHYLAGSSMALMVAVHCLPAFCLLATVPFCPTLGKEGRWTGSSSVRRAAVTAFLLWFNSHTPHGNASSTSSAPCFYYSHYPFPVQGFSFLISTAGVLWAVDMYGRRPVLVMGMLVAGVFNVTTRAAAMAGELKGVAAVAVVVLLGSCVRFAVSTLVYLIVSELGAAAATKEEDRSGFRGLLRAVARLDTRDSDNSEARHGVATGCERLV